MIWLVGLALAKPLVLSAGSDAEDAVQRVAEVTGKAASSLQGMPLGDYTSGLPVGFDAGRARGCYAENVPAAKVEASLQILQRPAVLSSPESFVDMFQNAEGDLACLDEPRGMGSFFFAKGRHALAMGDEAKATQAFRDARSMGFSLETPPDDVGGRLEAAAPAEGVAWVRLEPYPERVWVDGVLVTHADQGVPLSLGRHLVTVRGTRTTTVDLTVEGPGTLLLPAIYDGRIVDQLAVAYRSRAMTELMSMGRASVAYLSDGVSVWKASKREVVDLTGVVARSTGISRRPGDDVACLPAATFLMGENGNDRHAAPQHLVYVDGFCLFEHPVTQAEYLALTGQTPSHHADCPDCPVDSVSWTKAIEYANALSRTQGLKPAYDSEGVAIVGSGGWRLPTEAEWEMAARGGEPHRFSGSNDVTKVGHTLESAVEGSPPTSQPVGSKKPNGFGLYDLSGNVSEWVGDWSAPYEAGLVAAVNPTGPELGDFKVVRGGSYARGAEQATVSHRGVMTPTASDPEIGFRLVRTPQ